MSKRGRPVTFSEEELLAAAREVFLERGLDATTADVAKRAKISEGGIFHRYKTKEALLLAILDHELGCPKELEELSSLVGKGEIADHLFRLETALVKQMRTMVPFFMLACSSPIRMSELQERFYPYHRRMIRQLGSYIEAEARLGRLRRMDSEIVAHVFLGSLREYVTVEVTEGAKSTWPLPEATYLRGMSGILLEAGTPQGAGGETMGWPWGR